MWFKLLITSLFVISSIGALIVVITDDGDSGHKVAWILALVMLPVVGLLLYLLFGVNWRIHPFFKKHHKRFTDLFEAQSDAATRSILFDDGQFASIREEFRPLARLLSDSRLSPQDGNDFEIITKGPRKYELLMQDLREAKESIHIEYFRFGADKGGREVRELIMKKAAEGVKVRYIHENFANIPIPASYYDQMVRSGVEMVRFTSPRQNILTLITRLNYRNHRKIVVIDGRIGYTGGMNINDNYFKEWRDTHMRITGKAVASLQHIFMDSWITAGGNLDKPLNEFYRPEAEESWPGEGSGGHLVQKGKILQVVPDEPEARIPLIQMSYEWALHNTRRYIYMQTPYLAPPTSILNALKTAAACGADVRIMLPQNVDSKIMRACNCAYYKECLGAGVRLFERQGEFIHSKTFVMDDYLSCIGTANIDFRSFAIDYEDNVYIYDTETARQCVDIFENDLKTCREITLEEVRRWPWYRKFYQKLIRLFAPLL